jgi:hypothetical protein
LVFPGRGFLCFFISSSVPYELRRGQTLSAEITSGQQRRTKYSLHPRSGRQTPSWRSTWSTMVRSELLAP